MRKLIKSLVAVSVLTAMATVAYAGDIGYTTGDLLLSFRQWDGANAGAKNLTFDIGTFSANYSGKMNVTVGTYDLSSVGSGMNNMQFSIVGGSISGSGPTATSTEFVSKSRVGAQAVNAAGTATLVGTEASWVAKTSSQIEQSRSRIETIGGGALAAGISDGDGSSYHTAVGNNGDFVTKFQGNVETTVAVGSTVYADLFTMTGKSTFAASSVSYSGNFKLVDHGDNTVTVIYNYNAVPEPATFGVLAAAGLLLVSTRRQLRKQA